MGLRVYVRRMNSQLVQRFAINYRVVFSMCYAAKCELVSGATVCIAEYNGLN